MFCPRPEWYAALRSMDEQLELSLPATPVSVREARERIGEFLSSAGAASRVVEDAKLCVSEAVANVVRHAYGLRQGDFTIAVERQGAEVTVVVRDRGVGLTRFAQEGDLGYGLRIIDRLTHRSTITSAPNSGTEIVMVFSLDDG
jgi:anti-sigma regulatory factor (Ser/Thr protein kinase)